MKCALPTLLFLLILGITTATRAQIGMGGPPHSSAVLDLKSPANDKAFYPPRLTTAQRLAIASPQPGAFVYDLDKGTMFLHDGQNWLPLATTDTNLLAPITRTADDGSAYDFFGYSVAISGDYALVGAYGDRIGSNANQGSAYVFVRSGSSWVQQAKLTASDGAAFDVFGHSVALSGDYALVGADGDDSGSNSGQGSAYVFVRSGSSWTFQAKLTANDGAANDLFGFSVAISGDYALVGAFDNDIGSNTNQGSAYVYVRSGETWTQQAKLIANDGAASDLFGTSVALSGDYALVGALSVFSNSGKGSAYVYVRSGETWTQQAKLTANDGAVGDNFGISVAISGDYALIGAYGDDIGSNSNQGSAYVFVRSSSSWVQQAKITASDGAVNDLFGYSVAISGDYALVGAYKDDIGSNDDQGSAYVFLRSGTSWWQNRKVTDTPLTNTSNGFSIGISNGFSVGLSNGTFIIGGYGLQSYKGKVAFGTVE